MADFLIDLAQYLIANGIGQEIGKDIHLDYRPDKPDSIIVLTEYAGPQPQLKIDVVSRRVQVLVRDKSFENCKSRAWKIFNLLSNPDDEGEIFAPSGRWMIPHPLQTPYRLDIDEKNRAVYTFNLGVATIKD